MDKFIRTLRNLQKKNMILVIEYHNITLKKEDKNLFFINSIYI